MPKECEQKTFWYIIVDRTWEPPTIVILSPRFETEAIKAVKRLLGGTNTILGDKESISYDTEDNTTVIQYIIPGERIITMVRVWENPKSR